MTAVQQRDETTVVDGLPGQLSPIGLALPERLTFTEWERVGETLKTIRDSSLRWWWGDWLNYGERKYGDAYSQAIEASDYSYQTHRNSAWVSGRIELSRRRDKLSFSHHQEVAALAPAAQDRWLARAEREGWSRNTLREMIADARQSLPPSDTPLGDVPQGGPDERDEHDAVLFAGGDWAEVAQETVDARANHQLINASTNNEWFTPRPFLDAAHELMGGIDLDPASNEFANLIVRAARYFAIDDDGYAQEWRGRVWLNPPYGLEDGESNQARWSRRLVAEYRSGNVTEALLLVNAVTGNGWFAPLKQFPICFPDSRIRFYNQATIAGQPTHSNAIIYLGPQLARFADIFGRFGAVMATREVWLDCA